MTIFINRNGYAFTPEEIRRKAAARYLPKPVTLRAPKDWTPKTDEIDAWVIAAMQEPPRGGGASGVAG